MGAGDGFDIVAAKGMTAKVEAVVTGTEVLMQDVEEA